MGNGTLRVGQRETVRPDEQPRGTGRACHLFDLAARETEGARRTSTPEGRWFLAGCGGRWGGWRGLRREVAEIGEPVRVQRRGAGGAAHGVPRPTRRAQELTRPGDLELDLTPSAPYDHAVSTSDISGISPARHGNRQARLAYPRRDMDVALIVVGDEILNGSVADENIAFLGGMLAARGHRLARASVVGDDPAQIAAEVRAQLDAAVALVLVSGGLGPTHDDRTVEGVAAALGGGISVCEPFAEMIGSWVARAEADGVGGDALGAGWLHKMALVPDGATLLECSRPGIPAFHVASGATDIVILPGPPWMFRLVVEETVAPRFLPDVDLPVVEEIEHGFPESSLAAILDDLARAHDAVAIGSYPQRGRVLIRVRGPAEVVGAVAMRLRAHLEEFGATPEGARLLGRAHR